MKKYRTWLTFNAAGAEVCIPPMKFTLSAPIASLRFWHTMT